MFWIRIIWIIVQSYVYVLRKFGAIRLCWVGNKTLRRLLWKLSNGSPYAQNNVSKDINMETEIKVSLPFIYQVTNNNKVMVNEQIKYVTMVIWPLCMHHCNRKSPLVIRRCNWYQSHKKTTKWETKWINCSILAEYYLNKN